jgi:hypothetical protein
MNIKKGNLEVLFKVLQGTEGRLSLAESRIRDAVVKPLFELLKTFEGDRRAIYDKFCTKAEDGTPDLTGDQYNFPPDVLEQVNEELKTLYSEDVVLPVIMPSALQAVMERTGYQPKIGEVEVIDELLALLDPDVGPKTD